MTCVFSYLFRFHLLICLSSLPLHFTCSSSSYIGFTNPNLTKFIVPSSVLEWARNSIANRLAVDGASWIDTFSRYNSGTYNNQNMIFDYNKFTPGQPLINGTFYLCEQVCVREREREYERRNRGIEMKIFVNAFLFLIFS